MGAKLLNWWKHEEQTYLDIFSGLFSNKHLRGWLPEKNKNQNQKTKNKKKKFAKDINKALWSQSLGWLGKIKDISLEFLASD